MIHQINLAELKCPNGCGSSLYVPWHVRKDDESDEWVVYFDAQEVDAVYACHVCGVRRDV